jgi:L-fucose mutarotase
MIRNTLTHPEILSSLAAAGHGSTVLITDGHYAARTAIGPNASRVYLNLTADWPRVTDVLRLVLGAVEVEAATMIRPSPDALPCEAQAEIGRLLPSSLTPQLVDRARFYDRARSLDLVLCIVTGDTRRFANVLLTVGVLRDPSGAGATPL